MMTSNEAQVLHDSTLAQKDWMAWFVSLTDPTNPGRAVAWAVTADFSGGTKSPGLLVADTLQELRGMLPPGLTRRDRTPLMAPNVLETWD